MSGSWIAKLSFKTTTNMNHLINIFRGNLLVFGSNMETPLISKENSPSQAFLEVKSK
jgi:hypothetical protein